YGNRLMYPTIGEFLRLHNQILRRHRWPRFELSSGLLTGGKHLHLGTAYIDNQYVHLGPNSSPGHALVSTALFEAITPINSFQDLTNDAAPSLWSFEANASISMPALPKR